MADHDLEKKSIQLAIEAEQLRAQLVSKRAELDRLYSRGEALFNAIADQEDKIQRIEAARLGLSDLPAIEADLDDFNMRTLNPGRCTPADYVNRDELLNVIVSCKARLASLDRLKKGVEAALERDRKELALVNERLDGSESHTEAAK